MNKKKRKKWIIGTIILLIIILSIFIVVKRNEQPFDVSYETAAVSRDTIRTSISATGSIEPVTEVEVGTQVSGIIDKILVDYNSVVHKGQVIALLDRTNLLSELNSAKSQLASAKSDLAYQEANYKRVKNLYEKSMVSADEYDTARLALLKAKQTCLYQEESVNKAQTNLNYATITSPIDGVVISKDVEEGQTVASSFETPTLFTIAKDLTDMRVIADVDEADIGGVKEGLRVSFTVDAYPNETFDGIVTQVRQNATTTDNVVTYEVAISAPNPDLKLKPGLTANVTIYTLERTNVLSVPTKALKFTPTRETIGPKDKIVDCKGSQKVWIKDGRTFKAIAVQTGITDGIRTEIKSGIAAGQKVIVDMKAAEEETESTASQDEQNPFAPGPPKKEQKGK